MATNIRNADSYMGSFWDWTAYNDLFSPTKIRISDIDGVVERNGHFLYIETKSPGAEITTGQRIMHDAWIKKGDSVLVIWGDANRPERACLRWRGKAWEYSPCNESTVREIIRRWFHMANTGVAHGK